MTRCAATPLRVLALGAAAATLAKLLLAATTYGTNDVGAWSVFAGAVRAYGPVGIYGHELPNLYNHGPLAGWMLVGVNGLADLGLPFTLLIRVPASLADLGTAFLVFALLRRFRSEREAAAAALAVVWSPVLLVVSGFHGNTDPVFVMLALLSVYLLAIRGRAFGAGLAIGLAVSIKLVPLVVLPWLLWLALRRGSGTLVRFAAGGAVVAVVLWTPVLLTQWSGFRDHVLGYRGIPVRQWGISEILSITGGDGALDAYAGLSLVLLALAALAPLALLRHRRGLRAEVAGLSVALIAFLALSPAFAMQYLAWGVAATYLLAPIRLAHVANLWASAFVLVVYSEWNGGPPWTWDRAIAEPFGPTAWVLMWPTWAALLLVLVAGVRNSRRDAPIESEPERIEGDRLVAA